MLPGIAKIKGFKIFSFWWRPKVNRPIFLFNITNDMVKAASLYRIDLLINKLSQYQLNPFVGLCNVPCSTFNVDPIHVDDLKGWRQHEFCGSHGSLGLLHYTHLLEVHDVDPPCETERRRTEMECRDFIFHFGSLLEPVFHVSTNCKTDLHGRRVHPGSPCWSVPGWCTPSRRACAPHPASYLEPVLK